MATPTTKEIDRRLLDYGSPQGDAAHRQGGWLTVGKAMVDAREEVFENPRHQSRRHPRLSPGVRYGPQARKAPR